MFSIKTVGSFRILPEEAVLTRGSCSYIRSARCSRVVLSKLLAARKANFLSLLVLAKKSQCSHALECWQRPFVTPLFINLIVNRCFKIRIPILHYIFFCPFQCHLVYIWDHLVHMSFIELISHNSPYLPPKILHNLCFSFLLAKFWGANKVLISYPDLTLFYTLFFPWPWKIWVRD